MTSHLFSYVRKRGLASADTRNLVPPLRIPPTPPLVPASTPCELAWLQERDPNPNEARHWKPVARVGVSLPWLRALAGPREPRHINTPR